jgi:predicted PurR-regulated permease PerM
MTTEWTKTTKHIVGVGLALFGLYILYLSRSVLTLVVIAALVAFILMPVVDFFNRRCRIPRGLAVLLAYLLLILVILLAPLVFVPPVIDGFQSLLKVDYQILIVNILNWAEQTLLYLKNVDAQAMGFTLDLAPYIDPALDIVKNTEPNFVPALPSFETLMTSLRSAVSFTYGFATNVAGTVFSGAITFIVTLLSAIYISLDGPNFMHYFLATVPEPVRPEVATLMSRLRKIWRAYFRGQLNLMLIIGVVTWIVGTVIGLPGAFALAVIAGVMELIPNLGPFLAAVPAVIVALIQGSTYLEVSHLVFALIVIGMYLLIQQLENTFIVPRILGEAVDLHPMVVMIGVVVGANAAGILGALLAAPVIASMREISGYFYAKILGQEPYPAQADTPEPEAPSWLERGRQVAGKLQQIWWRPGSPPALTKDATIDPPPEK